MHCHLQPGRQMETLSLKEIKLKIRRGRWGRAVWKDNAQPKGVSRGLCDCVYWSLETASGREGRGRKQVGQGERRFHRRPATASPTPQSLAGVLELDEFLRVVLTWAVMATPLYPSIGQSRNVRCPGRGRISGLLALCS